MEPGGAEHVAERDEAVLGDDESDEHETPSEPPVGGGPEGFADATARARLAQIALGLNVMLYLATCAMMIVDGAETQSEAIWAMSDAFWERIEVVELGLRLLTAIAFLSWVHQVSRNAHAIGDPTPKHSPGAAVGYWFVPCGNLWLPYQVVSEIDRVSDPESQGQTSGWVAGWWAAWVASTFFSRIAASGPGPEVALVVILLHLTAAALAIVVVERITRNQIVRASRADVSTIARTFE